ncbi:MULTISPECIES: hypothetical protein [Asticcacaulis]|uniref:hypothetical protein n=1 Tax=Asticcacaulis TaxID=76890 RepID=UPI001AEB26A1|nr:MULTISPECIES: hypothetical protein [Asticcacaulis]MBP2160461.1 DNA-directed RNA polymerase specialized sigma24 family protein [Asticcacaulis solisilvae]MDR6801506.1 DNA-directed RNA polymerase specialized sigma24 family protein [Asticcacaulis sp. BE141]
MRKRTRAVPDAPDGIDALLVKVAQRDKTALKVIYQSAGPWLYTMIRASEDNEEAADEILEAVFLCIWDQAWLFNPRQESGAQWLSRLLARQMSNRLH